MKNRMPQQSAVMLAGKNVPDNTLQRVLSGIYIFFIGVLLILVSYLCFFIGISLICCDI